MFPSRRHLNVAQSLPKSGQVECSVQELSRAVSEKERNMVTEPTYVRWFEELSAQDVAWVGGKQASLGEMIRFLPDRGFALLR
jgi:hypothetical protein